MERDAYKSTSSASNFIFTVVIRLFYPVRMLEKEVKQWSLLSALIIYCYCLQRLLDSLKFVNTKRNNYLLTLKLH